MSKPKNGIKFSVYNTPAGNGTESKSYARIITAGTKRIDDICEFINECSSLSPADIKGVLEALTTYIGRELSYGYSVELDGLGHFTAALRTTEVSSGKGGGKGKTSCAVHVRGVNFRASRRLKELARQESLVKLKRDNLPSQELGGRRAKMLRFLEGHPYVNLSDYMTFNGCTYYRAREDFKRFLEEGIISPTGCRTHRVYVLSSPANDDK